MEDGGCGGWHHVSRKEVYYTSNYKKEMLKKTYEGPLGEDKFANTEHVKSCIGQG